MLLTILYGKELQNICNHGFQKSLTLEEVKIIIADLTHIQLKDLNLQRFVGQGKVIDLSTIEDKGPRLHHFLKLRSP